MWAGDTVMYLLQNQNPSFPSDWPLPEDSPQPSATEKSCIQVTSPSKGACDNTDQWRDVRPCPVPSPGTY